MKFTSVFILLISLLFFINHSSFSQSNLLDCKASLMNDTLIISNSKIERRWHWISGNIVPVLLKNMSTGKVLPFEDKLPGFNLVGKKFLKSTDFKIEPVNKSIYGAAHLAVSFISNYDGVDLKRVFKIYPHLPTISMDIYLKYATLNTQPVIAAATSTGVEKPRTREEPEQSYCERLALDSKHWELKVVKFTDRTDEQNNLVSETEAIPFRSKANYLGNLLLAYDLVTENSFFVLKEAPNTTSQINYPGFDYIASNKYINIPFSGFENKNFSNDWLKGYTITIGVSKDKEQSLFALREYLKGSINYEAKNHEMIMMNTWGDRGQDGKINEEFILRELEAGAKLGITHFQIDDGWQQGLSQNSAATSGKLWDAWKPENWEPNKERFPNGITSIIASAKQKNIQLGLWFHPSNENEYETWKTDAGILVSLYRTHGIRYFKIDGVKIETKKAEINFTKFLEEVKRASNNNVFFNLDVTANVRGGYFMFKNAGNLFLENRYTDAGVYFPSHTLRNLWMLSKYFPPELLQIEFLNKWTNVDKYLPADILAPSNYSFDSKYMTKDL